MINEGGVHAEHMRRHVIKGWTTRATSRGSYTAESLETGTEEVESQDHREPVSERGAHIYKHVIKGWTMNPHADEGFKKTKSKPGENDINNVVSVYR